MFSRGFCFMIRVTRSYGVIFKKIVVETIIKA